jgi:hypothetical protein
MRTCSALLALALAAPLGLAQGSFTVDDNGPADFSDLQLAVDTVPPGSLLSLAPGLYGAAEIKGPLRIVGAGADYFVGSVVAALSISGLEPGEEVVLRELIVDPMVGVPASSPGQPAINVYGNAGAVWLEGVEAHADARSASPAGPTLRVQAHCAVYLRDCALLPYSRPPLFPFVFGAPDGLSLGGGARVAAFDCEIVGSDGWSAHTFPSDGGAGAAVDTGSVLFAARSTLRGGGGYGALGPGGQWNCGENSPALITKEGAAAYLESTAVEGGASPVCAIPVAPPLSICGTCPFDQQTATYRAAAAPALVAVPGAVAVELDGAPGEPVLLFLAADGDFQLLPTLGGGLWLSAPWFLLTSTSLDPQGQALLSFDVPPLAAPLVPLWLQGLHLGPGGDFTLGAATTTLLLN